MALLILGFVVFLFTFVIFFGAPYLPSKRRQINIALDMLEVQKGSVIVDLGSGDGVFLKAAAAKGAVVYGYELNPILYIVSLVRCWRYRSRVHIRLGNFWHAPLPGGTTGVYSFLLGRFMHRLETKITQESIRLKRPLKLACFTFDIPGRPVIRSEEAVFLYAFTPQNALKTKNSSRKPKH